MVPGCALGKPLDGIAQGIETLGQVLSKDNTIPVILHTAYSSYKDNFMTWSADAYVVKSSDLTELKAKLKEVTARQNS